MSGNVGAATAFQLRRLQARFLEVRDTHVHSDAAVLNPEFDPGYYLKLAALRCRSVQHALIGEKDDRVRVAQVKPVVRESQVILKWLSLYWCRDTDPLELDGTHGAHTDRALRRFKDTYNDFMEESLPVCGAVDRAIWGAFFEMDLETPRDRFETDREGIGDSRPGPRFFDFNRNRVACGESFPVEAADTDNF